MQYSITFELLVSGKRLSKPADALHRHRFKLIEAAGRGEATHGALAQESHENIVDRHRLFILALADSEQEDEMGGFVARAMPCGAITV